MIATILGLALGVAVPTELDPCAAWMSQDALTTDCVNIDVPPMTFGAVTAKAFDVVVSDDHDGEQVGYFKFQLGPEPTEGFYRYGAIPGCVRDGVLTKAGLGTAWEQPGYRTHSSNDESVVLSYIEDPCYTPGHRVAVFYGAYSDTEVVDPEDYVPGWDPSNVSNGIRATVTSAVPYGGSGRITVSIAHPCAGERDNSTCMADYFGAGGNTWVEVAQLCGTYQQNFAAAKTSGVYWATVTRSCDVTNFTGEVTFRWMGTSTRNYWRPFGHPLRVDPEQVGWSGQALVIEDTDLDSLVYNPLGESMVYADGQCTEWDCVASYCDDVDTLDVVGFIGCVFGMDVDLMEYIDTMVVNWHKFEGPNMIGYIVDLLRAWPSAARGLDGACGQIFDLTGTALEGMDGNTCELPLQYEVRTITGALLSFTFVIAIVGMIHRFFTTGHIRPIADGDLNNGDGI